MPSPINPNISIEIVRNCIIDMETQPKDGFALIMREEPSKEVIEVFSYDHSWLEDDAIQDALSKC